MASDLREPEPSPANLQQSFSSFGQTVFEVLGGSVHVFPTFQLELFIHGHCCKTFTHGASDLGEHTCSATYRNDNYVRNQDPSLAPSSSFSTALTNS